MAQSIRRHVTEMRFAAQACGVPLGIVEAASTATERRFAGARSRARQRENYFWSVVRRRSIRAVGARDLANRLVLEAVVADMREHGRDEKAVREELERGWRGRVADHVLDDCCSSLCA